MKLILAALSIILVSALFYFGLTKISGQKGIESFEIGFHIRLTGNDLLKDVDTHTSTGDTKNRFPVKGRKDIQATVADPVRKLELRPLQLDSSYDAKDSSIGELYIERDKLYPDSNEFHKIYKQ